jgi:shikimate dehydrogenase
MSGIFRHAGWPSGGMKPRYRFGLIGHSIPYTLSAAIFKRLFSLLEIEGKFDVADVPPDGFEAKLESFRNTDGFAVTIPYKERVISYLHRISEEALAIGAVNSVKVEHGRLLGYNTDTEGFLFPLRRALFAGGRVLILGHGGAARAVTWALGNEYSQADITMCGRDAERVAQFADELIYANGVKVVSRYITYQDLNVSDGYDLVVNCTPVGGGSLVGCTPVPDNFPFHLCRICYDLVYAPARTRFLTQAEKAGCMVIGGLPMLVRQAVASYILWTGHELDGEAVTDRILGMVSPDTGDQNL